jgi:hypothetical protein
MKTVWQRCTAKLSRIWLYLALMGIGLCLFLISLPELIRYFGSVPFLLGATGAIYSVSRDEAERTFKLDLQRAEHTFTVAATSHMAIVLFDKHVDFCEKYIAKFNQLVDAMIADGYSVKGLPFILEMRGVRREYLLWLDESMTSKLERFESAVVGMTVSNNTHHEILRTRELEEGEEAFLDHAFNTLVKLLGLSDELEPDKESSYHKVISHLQGILMVSELTELRRRLVKNLEAPVEAA